MSRASTPTLLPLSDWARYLGLDPLHFAGGYSTLRPPSNCDDTWMQYDWQNHDRVAREQVAEHVADAERDIAKLCGYWPAPVWVQDEYHEYPRPYDRLFYGTGTTPRGDAKSISLLQGYVLYGGQRATELIAEGGAPVYSDADGDGFDEWATFTVAGVDPDLDACEVRAYYKVFDSLDTTNTRPDPTSAGADPAWEIKPIFATQTGGTLTVRIPSWELFRVDLQERFDAQGINADDATSYVDTVVFYREYNDPESQVQFIWNEADCAVASMIATQTGVLLVKDRRAATVALLPGTYDAASDSFSSATWTEGREPDAVRVYYRAGYRPEGAQGCSTLDRFWARLITILATARLHRPICSCGAGEAAVEQWAEDLTRQTAGQTYQLSASVVECPLGPRRGEVYVWKQIAKVPGLRRARGIRLY